MHWKYDKTYADCIEHSQFVNSHFNDTRIIIEIDLIWVDECVCNRDNNLIELWDLHNFNLVFSSHVSEIFKFYTIFANLQI